MVPSLCGLGQGIQKLRNSSRLAIGLMRPLSRPERTDHTPTLNPALHPRNRQGRQGVRATISRNEIRD